MRHSQHCNPEESDVGGMASPTATSQEVETGRTITHINFITGNANKLREVAAILADVPGIVLTSTSLDLPEVQSASLEEVTLDKARRAAVALASLGDNSASKEGAVATAETEKEDGVAVVTRRAVLVEDTALCFDALGNGQLPGPYIKWFLSALGHDGLNRLLDGFEGNRGAEAVCTFAYCPVPDTPAATATTSGSSAPTTVVESTAMPEPIIFQGRTRGRIVAARGEGKFGWDPIFECAEGEEGKTKGRTYAEMSAAEKNAVSHRGRALEKLKLYLAKER